MLRVARVSDTTYQRSVRMLIAIADIGPIGMIALIGPIGPIAMIVPIGPIGQFAPFV